MAFPNLKSLAWLSIINSSLKTRIILLNFKIIEAGKFSHTNEHYLKSIEATLPNQMYIILNWNLIKPFRLVSSSLCD